jgi:hypothetical protein
VARNAEGPNAVVRSDDNGKSWYTFAISEEAYDHVYAGSGSQRITPDGNIVGVFTHQHGQEGDA